MGVHYYLVVPKLKILIWIGRNIHEDCIEEDEESLLDFFKIWSDYNYEGEIPQLFEIKEKTLKEFKVEDLILVVFYMSKMENFLMLQNSPETIIRYIIGKTIDKNSYIISDCSEEFNKLGKKYKIVEEDE